MKTYPLYFRDLKPALQEELAQAHGYASTPERSAAAEYEADTNGDVMPLVEFVLFDKDEEPPDGEA